MKNSSLVFLLLFKPASLRVIGNFIADWNWTHFNEFNFGRMITVYLLLRFIVFGIDKLLIPVREPFPDQLHPVFELHCCSRKISYVKGLES